MNPLKSTRDPLRTQSYTKKRYGIIPYRFRHVFDYRSENAVAIRLTRKSTAGRF